MASFTKLPSGKWRARVRAYGNARSATFATKSQAKSWASNVESQLNDRHNGVKSTVPGLRLEHLIDLYTEEATPGRSRTYTLAMLKRELGKLNPAHIDAALYPFVDKRLKEAGGVTLAGDLSVLSSVLKWGAVVKNLNVDLDAPKKHRANLTVRKVSTRSNKRERLITDDELARFYEFAAERDARAEINLTEVVKFAVASAMRVGEICRIELEDVDQEQRTIIIRQRKHPTEKASNDQTVPLIGDAWEIIKAKLDAGESGRVFKYDPRSVGNAFRKVVRKAGIEDARFHDLRHRGITDLFKRGLPIQLVAIVSGHSDWAQLKRYTRLNAGDVHAALVGLNER